MSAIVSCSSLFLKQVEVLSRTGGKSARAVDVARQIYVRLKHGDDLTDFLKIKQTKNGEKRLKCIEKYDLGAGYRLVCRKVDGFVTLEFVGTHDRCDVWLNNRRREKSQAPSSIRQWETPSDTVECAGAGCEHPPFQEHEEDRFEEYLLEQVDDRFLRRLFSGLISS